MNRKLRKNIKSSSADPSADTRERVLDVAERLFAERGLDAVSIRDITSAAEVNLGAINYHFGTKENLIAATIQRRTGPLNQQRLQALEAAEKAAGDKPLKLEVILEVIFRPVIELAMDTRNGGNVFSKLIARCMVDAHPVMESIMKADFLPFVMGFEKALIRAMPQLNSEEVFWRMHLLIGALHHSLIMIGRPLPDGRRVKFDAETYLKRFIAFAAAGFRAPLPLESK